MFNEDSTQYLGDLKRKYTKNLIQNLQDAFEENGWSMMGGIWSGKARDWEVSVWLQRDGKNVYLMFSADFNGETSGDAVFGIEADTEEDANKVYLRDVIDAYLVFVHLTDDYGPTLSSMAAIAGSAIADYESKDRAGQVVFPIPYPVLQSLAVVINAQPMYASQGVDPNVHDVEPLIRSLLKTTYENPTIVEKVFSTVMFFADSYCKVLDPSQLMTVCALLSLFGRLGGKSTAFDIEVALLKGGAKKETMH